MENPSYQRKEPFTITEEIRQEIAGAVGEIDLAQMAIIAKLTPAQRVRMAASMIKTCERTGVQRLLLRQPELSEHEAHRIVRGGLFDYHEELWPEVKEEWMRGQKPVSTPNRRCLKP